MKERVFCVTATSTTTEEKGDTFWKKERISRLIPTTKHQNKSLSPESGFPKNHSRYSQPFRSEPIIVVVVVVIDLSLILNGLVVCAKQRGVKLTLISLSLQIKMSIKMQAFRVRPNEAVIVSLHSIIIT